jgi:hypothetical protein
MTIAMIGADNAGHMTSAMPQTFANPMVDVARFPVTQPIDRILAGLNAYQPITLMGYPSMLALLAVEARAGRLRILPRRITTTSKPLLPEVRRALTETFCAPVANMYGTSEAGPIGVGCFRGPGIHLCDDLVVVEPVDLAGRPVPPGVRSDKVYVTAIANPTLPLIRFELTDQVTSLDTPCPCGSAHQLIADVESRLDDVFAYPGGQVVHPHVFGALLRRDPRIVEYQVRQAPAGAEVLVVGAPADPAALARALEAELARLGVPDPAVEVRLVDHLDRQATGKVRRFLPRRRWRSACRREVAPPVRGGGWRSWPECTRRNRSRSRAGVPPAAGSASEARRRSGTGPGGPPVPSSKPNRRLPTSSPEHQHGVKAAPDPMGASPSQQPPQMTISVPVHTATWRSRAASGAAGSGFQASVAGS